MEKELMNGTVPNNALNEMVEGIVKDSERILELEKQLAAGWKENDELRVDMKKLINLAEQYDLCFAHKVQIDGLKKKYAIRNKYTIEQLREKLGEDFDIIK